MRARNRKHREAPRGSLELVGASLRLRGLRRSDAPRILELLRNPEVSRYFLWEPPRDLAEARQYVEGFQHEVEHQWAYHFAIAGSAQEALLGVANLYHIDTVAREAEIGLWLGRAYWGQGLQQEASHLLIDFGFRTLDLRRITFQVDEENARAQAAFRKLGAAEAGRAALYSARQDRSVEHRVYALEASTWREESN